VGWTPLIIASSAGHSDIVTYLLQLERVNVDAINSTGQTAMHYAASKDRLQVNLLIFTVYCIGLSEILTPAT